MDKRAAQSRIPSGGAAPHYFISVENNVVLYSIFHPQGVHASSHKRLPGSSKRLIKKKKKTNLDKLLGNLPTRVMLLNPIN
jgi:hypothetical protein